MEETRQIINFLLCYYLSTFIIIIVNLTKYERRIKHDKKITEIDTTSN